jgi:hypothetical protein
VATIEALAVAQGRKAQEGEVVSLAMADGAQKKRFEKRENVKRNERAC